MKHYKYPNWAKSKFSLLSFLCIIFFVVLNLWFDNDIHLKGVILILFFVAINLLLDLKNKKLLKPVILNEASITLGTNSYPYSNINSLEEFNYKKNSDLTNKYWSFGIVISIDEKQELIFSSICSYNELKNTLNEKTKSA